MDASITSSVTDILIKRGYHVVDYKSDKVSDRSVGLSMDVADGRLALHYNNEKLDLSNIGAAWFRRPHFFQYKKIYDDAALKLCIDRECKALQQTLWELVADEYWLNSPTAMYRTEPKILQLKVANDLGFMTPKTIVSNNWDHIQTALAGNKEIVFKMFKGVLFRDNKGYGAYTQIFKNDPKQLPLDTSPYPGIWQEYLSKKREWRITVVGEKVFSASVHTTELARDDWRKHQTTSEVKFLAEEFPKELQAKCLQYLKHFGLRYGAFDFIEDLKGDIYFLELNPNGQFSWLEEQLGLPISAAIADELMAICENTV